MANLLHAAKRAKGPVLWLLLCAALAAAALCGWRWASDARQNATIAAILDGGHPKIDPAAASSRLLAAAGYDFTRRDMMQPAQDVLDQASWRAEPADRAELLYNMANARLRLSVDEIDQGNFDKGTALVNLAKSEYRKVLILDPGDWDAKFNLDIASRLVRDLPQAAPQDEEEPKEAPKDLWMNLPGIPQGEP